MSGTHGEAVCCHPHAFHAWSVRRPHTTPDGDSSACVALGPGVYGGTTPPL